MSIWSTKSSGRDTGYVLLRHTLRGVNYVINGVRFRDSYAVVQKDSKTYRNLKAIPVLKAAQEYPLIILRDLKFITRPQDVKTVYGADVYVQYLKELDKEIKKEVIEQKVELEIKHVELHKKCSHRVIDTSGKLSENNALCSMDALEHSPSGYCFRHILDEPMLNELGIDVPKFIPKKDKQDMKNKVSEQLKKLKKEGRF